MDKDKIRIAIIGAGPSGIAAAMPFLKYEDKFEVTIISSGDSPFTKDINDLKKYLISQDRDAQHRYWESKEYNDKHIIPKKLFFGSHKIYQDIENDLKKTKEIDFDVSHTIGGLSNVWGATVTGISKNDLQRYYYNSDIGEHFNKITTIFPIAGCNDSIDSSDNFKIRYHKILLKYCSQAKKIVRQFNDNRDFCIKNNFRLGLAKLAINTSRKFSNKICENTGLEMYGCNNDSIFNSLFAINEVQDKFNLIKNTLVYDMLSNNSSVKLKCINNEKKQIDLLFDKVIVAAGTVNTSKLILKLLSVYNKSSLVIKDSQKYFFLYFTFFKSMKDEEKYIVGLSQIFAQTEIEKNTLQIQFYHSKVFIKGALNRIFSSKVTNLFYKYLKIFLDRIMIGVVYFPEEISHHMMISYNKKNKKFFAKKIKNKKFSIRFIVKLYLKLNKFIFSLKSIPLPYFYRCKVGVSQHFGSSVPPSKNLDIGKTSLNGSLYPFNNIYIADSSSLERVSATPPTYISMSNAYRISSNIIKENI